MPQTQDSFPEWRAEFSVGSPLLDQQHKILLRLCHDSANLSNEKSQDGMREFHRVLNELSDYAEQHFRTEEALLVRAGYAELPRHQEEHNRYRSSLAELLYDSLIGVVDQNRLKQQLADWWMEHILSCDKHYAEHLRHDL